MKIYILEGFRLKCVIVSMVPFSHFSLNVVPWYATVSKKIVSVSDVSAGEFHSRVICKFTRSVNFEEIYDVWFTFVPQGKNVIYVAFSNGWFGDGLA